MFYISELEIPNALPRACIKLSIRNRNRDTSANQRALDMGGHIIAALCIMAVQALALFVLGHDAIQRRIHVCAHILIPVFVEREGARRVLDEEVE